MVFELLLLAVFAFFIVHVHLEEVRTRDYRRLEFQSSTFALLSRGALAARNMDALRENLSVMMQASSIAAIRITDDQGRSILASATAAAGHVDLTPIERRYLNTTQPGKVFALPGGRLEAVAPVMIQGRPDFFIWITPDEHNQRAALYSELRLILAFAVVGALGCILLAEYLARSITRPLSRLLQATRRIIRDPVDTTTLPPDGVVSSEVADLTLAFNLMVASVEEQRNGLNDTLSLLDSMLAHAPVGLAFFDSHARFIRINQFFADMNRLSIGRHIGFGVAAILPGAPGRAIEEGIHDVFQTSESVRDLELNVGQVEEDGRVPTWLVNIYPVQGVNRAVRWVGAVIVDTTAIKRSEDALRRTEKLAAVGRLSASIAHEINNPLEAITNLLYLLHQLDGLDAKAAGYAELAAHEVARMSDIVQQTLRFHRQSTRQSLTNIGEILDSVVSLHRGRVLGLEVEVERRYRAEVELCCFAGEMRQLFANLIGNALDAMPAHGGRLKLAIRYSRFWQHPSVQGIRIVVADTGCGMSDATRRRIFEPFFTTKEATGTGLGLWVSAEIIQKHQGAVRIRSRVGLQTGQDPGRSGTVFMLFFPNASAAKQNPELVEALQPSSADS